jgi:hypothetical protein
MASEVLKIATLNFQNIKSIFFTSDVKKFVLDPLTCIIRCAVLSYKPYGTKISILNSGISYHEPTALQGTIRWSQGDKREDLHNIYNPILKSTQWYTKDNKDILNIFTLAKKGLEKLKNSYESSSIISHSLELYINIIELFINNNPEYLTDFLKNKNHVPKVYGEAEEDNSLYKSLKGLWNENQISIVNNILVQVENEKNDRNNWLEALDIILKNKEEKVYNIVTKTSTQLI